MKIKLIFFIIVSLSYLSCEEKTASIEILNPNIKLNCKKTDSIKEFYIYFKNNGNSELIIDNIRPTCKCIVECGLDKTLNIAPNKKDSIKLKFINDDKKNSSETIIVVSNTIPRFNFITIETNINEN